MVLEQLLKHAKRYGREGCDDYAASILANNLPALIEAIEKLDEVCPPPGKRPPTAELRAKRLLGITEEEA